MNAEADRLQRLVNATLAITSIAHGRCDKELTKRAHELCRSVYRICDRYCYVTGLSMSKTGIFDGFEELRKEIS